MLQLGLRLGTRPRALITTTPTEGPLLGRILAQPGTVVSGGRTGANPHLPPAFVAAVEALYGGTRMGRREIDGDYDGAVAGQLFPAALIARCRVRAENIETVPHSVRVERSRDTSMREETSLDIARDEREVMSFLKQTWPTFPPPVLSRFERVAIGVDPPSGGGTCGIVACAVDRAGHGHVLADHSVTGASPEGWAGAVVAAAALYSDPLVVAEINQGGLMVKSVLRTAGLTGRIKTVRASEGKAQRAVPVALLFEQGRVSLHGEMALLEEELAGLVAGAAYQGPGKSPDRADAMVWALDELMVERREVRVVGL